MIIKFKSLHANDLALLHQWFQEPTINKWYARGKHWTIENIKQKYEPRLLGKEKVPSFIIYINDEPAGFIQYYSCVNSYPEGVKGKENLLFKHHDIKELAGIDLFLADERQRGQGIGVKVILQFVEQYLNTYSAVVVDPDAINTKAVRCYEKAGFIQTSFSDDPNYIVMVKQIMQEEVLDEALRIVQAEFKTGITLGSLEFLSEADRRNRVLRIKLHSSVDTVPPSLILKQSLPELSDEDDQESFARFASDWAGLEFLRDIPQSAHTVPTFYGASKSHRFILIEDLGQEHRSLVDSLTFTNRKDAVSALKRFMKALGNFHASTYGHTEHYNKILQRIHPKAETAQEQLDFVLGDLIPKMKHANQQLGLTVSQALINEAIDLIEILLKPNPFTVLTHGDICPDNVFDHLNQDLQLIDFEWAVVRNALLDGTYLRMSMPTCWCAKAIPIKEIDYLESLYREELKRTIPAASDDIAYNTAYIQACGFWVLQQTLPYLEGILSADRIGPSGPVPKASLWKDEENTVRPRFISRLQSFVDVASNYNVLPLMQEMAKNMLLVLMDKWKDAEPLEVYPAFRGNG